MARKLENECLEELRKFPDGEFSGEGVVSSNADSNAAAAVDAAVEAEATPYYAAAFEVGEVEGVSTTGEDASAHRASKYCGREEDGVETEPGKLWCGRGVKPAPPELFAQGYLIESVRRVVVVAPVAAERILGQWFDGKFEYNVFIRGEHDWVCKRSGHPSFFQLRWDEHRSALRWGCKFFWDPNDDDVTCIVFYGLNDTHKHRAAFRWARARLGHAC